MLKKIVLSIFIFTIFYRIEPKRSPHRPKDPHAPQIIVCYKGTDEFFILNDSHLQEYPLFNLFDYSHFISRKLPTQNIEYRYEKNRTVNASILEKLNEELLIEIKQRKKKYTHFTILKDRDFRKKLGTGSLILKYKDYPFILKLFIENPESFSKPFSKGFEPTCFFMMGGGVNRHLNGFTRIKNLELLRSKIEPHPYWSQIVDFPRKWYWVPTNLSWLELTGNNIGGRGKVQSVQIPAIYGIICDEIQVEHFLSLNNEQDRKTALNLSNYLGQHIDPHIKNYAIEKGSTKIVPIDYEDFLTMVGLDGPNFCSSYVQWYSSLTIKMCHDTFGRTKRERRRSQFKSCNSLVMLS